MINGWIRIIRKSHLKGMSTILWYIVNRETGSIHAAPDKEQFDISDRFLNPFAHIERTKDGEVYLKEYQKSAPNR